MSGGGSVDAECARQPTGGIGWGESTQTLSTCLGEGFNKPFLEATFCSLIIIELGMPQS